MNRFRVLGSSYQNEKGTVFKRNQIFSDARDLHKTFPNAFELVFLKPKKEKEPVVFSNDFVAVPDGNGTYNVVNQKTGKQINESPMDKEDALILSNGEIKEEDAPPSPNAPKKKVRPRRKKKTTTE